MTMFRVIIVLFIALLAGCATPNQWSAIGETRAGRSELVIEPTPDYFCKLVFVYWLVAAAKSTQPGASSDLSDSCFEPLLQRFCDLSTESNQ